MRPVGCPVYYSHPDLSSRLLASIRYEIPRLVSTRYVFMIRAAKPWLVPGGGGGGGGSDKQTRRGTREREEEAGARGWNLPGARRLSPSASCSLIGFGRPPLCRRRFVSPPDANP